MRYNINTNKKEVKNLHRKKKHSKFEKLQIGMSLLMAVITVAGVAVQIFAAVNH